MESAEKLVDLLINQFGKWWDLYLTNLKESLEEEASIYIKRFIAGNNVALNYADLRDEFFRPYWQSWMRELYEQLEEYTFIPVRSLSEEIKRYIIKMNYDRFASYRNLSIFHGLNFQNFQHCLALSLVHTITHNCSSIQTFIWSSLI